MSEDEKKEFVFWFVRTNDEEEDFVLGKLKT
jgi:hypothetical protein